MKLTMIAACDANWGIGIRDQLPWKEPADLKHFRERTMGKHLLMGRKTFETLPGKLDGRIIHVASRSKHDAQYAPIESIIETAIDQGLDELVVAGGGEIYRQCLPICDWAEITRVPGQFPCDAHMVKLPDFGWEMVDLKRLTDKINVEYWKRK